ncbi:histidine kinase [Corynebacterium breve]|uniref:histidine kinase n=1 Tax=Corynebacterium breve TaxID=3049799 RepID=A0ABY8VBK1_9CORY|nr:histidine kinase [Corynebacterium breve]WIM66853.1 histidine kinase [Corynebacterium breve]
MEKHWPQNYIGAPTRVVILLAVLAGFSSLSGYTETQYNFAFAYAIFATLFVGFLFHPRWPNTMIIVVAVALTCALFDPLLAESFVNAIAVLYACYLAAAYSKRNLMPWLLAWLLIGVGIGVSLMLWKAQKEFGEEDLLARVGPAALIFVPIAWIVVGFFWRLGLDTRNRKHAWAALKERAELAGVVERNRIAREMHDIVSHSLSGITALADGARFAAKDNPGVAVDTLETISNESRRALGQMRGLLSVLRDDSGREALAAPGTAEIAMLIDEARAKGTDITVTGLDELPTDLPELTQFTLYRICQEMVTNMLRHASSPSGTLEFEMGNRIIITAANPADREPVQGGYGLTGMRERVAAHDGTMRTEFDGKEFLVQVVIPR